MLKNSKHKLDILNLAQEDGYVTARSVSKHLGLEEMLARKTLNYYEKTGWLKKVPAILKSRDKKNHYQTSYDITDTGKFELERLRRAFG